MSGQKEQSFKRIILSGQVLVLFLMAFDTPKALSPVNKEVALNICKVSTANTKYKLK